MLVVLLTLCGSGVSQVTCGIVLSYWLGVRLESLCVGAGPFTLAAVGCFTVVTVSQPGHLSPVEGIQGFLLSRTALLVTSISVPGALCIHGQNHTNTCAYR